MVALDGEYPARRQPRAGGVLTGGPPSRSHQQDRAEHPPARPA